MRVEYIIAMPNQANVTKVLDRQKLLIFWVWPAWIKVGDDTYWPAEFSDGGWQCREMNIDRADLDGINNYYVSCKLAPPVKIVGELNERKEIEPYLCEDCISMPKNITLNEWISGLSEVVGLFSEWVAHSRQINIAH